MHEWLSVYGPGPVVGMAGGAAAYEGVVGGTQYTWQMEQGSPTAKAFNAAFQAANGGRNPSDYGAMAYSAVKSLLMAVKSAGSVETDKVAASRCNNREAPAN